MKRHPFLGWIFALSYVGGSPVIFGYALWKPLGTILATRSFPTALALVLVGAWFLVCALTMLPEPHNGRFLLWGSVGVIPFILLMLLEAARTSPPFLLVGIALAVFPASGVLLMLMPKLSTRGNRRPWLAEAWPGIVLFVVGIALAVVVGTRTVPLTKFFVPGTMLPAERGP